MKLFYFKIYVSKSKKLIKAAKMVYALKGIDLILQLIDEFHLDVVLSYMGHIQQTAESSVRSLMKSLSSLNNTCEFKAQEFMDDGSNIDLAVSIDKEQVIFKGF